MPFKEGFSSWDDIVVHNSEDYGYLITLRMCTECRCYVRDSETGMHDEWHERIDNGIQNDR